MLHKGAFISPVLAGSQWLNGNAMRVCRRASMPVSRRGMRVTMKGNSEEDGSRSNDQSNVQRMRYRLEGLFGSEDEDETSVVTEEFNGAALREAIRERWGVEYDVQPQKRHGRVYVQIMWRYFEQQSFYMEEDEFASHCEAVAQLLRQWDAVDYFCDYISTIKKRPVVGITVNIPIPGIDARTATFE